MIKIRGTLETITDADVDSIETETVPGREDFQIIRLIDLRRVGYSGDITKLEQELETPTEDILYVEFL